MADERTRRDQAPDQQRSQRGVAGRHRRGDGGGKRPASTHGAGDRELELRRQLRRAPFSSHCPRRLPRGGLTDALMMKDVALYSVNVSGPLVSFGVATGLGYADPSISNTIGDVSGGARLHDDRRAPAMIVVPGSEPDQPSEACGRSSPAACAPTWCRPAPMGSPSTRSSLPGRAPLARCHARVLHGLVISLGITVWGATRWPLPTT